MLILLELIFLNQYDHNAGVLRLFVNFPLIGLLPNDDDGGGGLQEGEIILQQGEIILQQGESVILGYHECE